MLPGLALDLTCLVVAFCNGCGEVTWNGKARGEGPSYEEDEGEGLQGISTILTDITTGRLIFSTTGADASGGSTGTNQYW